MYWTKKFGVNLLLFLLGCVCAFLIFEILLRTYDPFKFRVRGDKIVLPANVEYTVKNNSSEKLDENIIHKKNSLGFRGEELPKNFENYLTIITVGGSTTECRLLSDDKEWAYVLGTNLKNHFKKLWINNAGLDGQSTFGHIVLMEDYIIKLKPKIVLFLVGINDVGTKNSRFYDGKVIKTLNFESVTGLLISMANYSEVLIIALNTYRYIKAKNMGLTHNTEINLEEVSKETIDISKENEFLVKQMHKEKYLNGYEMRLRRLIDISRENGIEPVFITQPALYGGVIDDITRVNLAQIKLGDINGELGWEVLELYNDITRKVGIRENVFVIDLAKELPKSSRYYYDWAHYTNEGAVRVADIIYEHLCLFLERKHIGNLSRDCNVLKTD